MLRLTKNRISRIPNHLALGAALLLLVTAAAGVGGTAPKTLAVAEFAAQATTDKVMQPEAVEPAKKDKRFKMSLYLFRFSR
jgi:hypothetical protein